MHRTEVAIAEIYDRFPVLKERRKQVAGTLSGGEQQILALARVLMRKAELILLDEPSVGMMPAKVNELFEMISSMRGSVTILLVEQNAEKALQLADSALVLELGQVVLEGPGELIRSDPKVRSAYLPE